MNIQIVDNSKALVALEKNEESDGSPVTLGRIFERAVADPNFPFLDISCVSPGFRPFCSIPVGLDYSIDAKATAFFFRNYVYLPQKYGSGRGFLEYLIPMYSRAASDSSLSLVTHAVALSSLGNYPGNSSLKVNASKAYGKALIAVNESLRDARERTSDNTLLTILMFSLYEACYGQPKVGGQSLSHHKYVSFEPFRSTQGRCDVAIARSKLMSEQEAPVPSTEKKSGTAWSSHIEGAVALAKLRGADDWKSEESIGIFRAIRSGMVLVPHSPLSCTSTDVVQLTKAIQSATPVDEFPGPKGWLCDDDKETNHANRLSIISLGLPNVRRYAQDVIAQTPGPQKDAELRYLIKMAQEIDGQFEHWYLTLPDTWGCRTIRMQHTEPTDLYSSPQWVGPIHVYDDLFIANIINDYRISRIFCQKLILLVTAALSSPEEREATVHVQRTAMYTARAMANDICSSVPFHLDLTLQPEQTRASGQEVHGEPLPMFSLVSTTMISELTGYDTAAEATGAYFLTWPLFVLKDFEVIPLAQRKWIMGRLFRIGLDFGLSSAQIMTMAQRQVLTSGPSFP